MHMVWAEFIPSSTFGHEQLVSKPTFNLLKLFWVSIEKAISK